MNQECSRKYKIDVVLQEGQFSKPGHGSERLSYISLIMWKTALKWTVIVFSIAGIAVILIVSALLFLVQTRPVQQIIQSKVNKAIPGAISWDRLRFSLLKGEFELSNLAVKDPEGAFLAGLEQLTLEIKLSDLISKQLTVASLHIEGVRADLVLDSTGNLNLLQAFPPASDSLTDTAATDASASLPFNIVVNNLTFKRGRVTWAAPSDSLSLDVGGIALFLSGNFQKKRVRAKFAMESGQLLSPQLNSRIHHVKFESSLAEGNIAPLKLSVKTDGSFINLEGRVDSVLKNPAVDLNLETSLDLDEMATASGMAQKLTGNLKVKAKIQGGQANPRLVINMNYAGGILAGWPVENLDLSLRLKDKLAELDSLKVDALTGSALLMGNADLSAAFPNGFGDSVSKLEKLIYNLALSTQRLNLAAMPLKDNNLQGILSGAITVEGSGVVPENLAGEVSADVSLTSFAMDSIIQPLNAALVISGRIEQAVAHVRQLDFNADSLSLSVNGDYHLLQNSLQNVQLALRAPNLARILPLVGVDSVSGALTAEAGLSGPVALPSGHVRLRSESLSYKNTRLGNLDFDGQLDDSGKLIIRELTVNNGGSRLSAAGEGRLFDGGKLLSTKNMTTDFQLTASPVLLEDFLDSLKGRITLDGRVSGPVPALSGSFRMNVDNLETGPQPLENLLLEAELDSGDINVKPLRINITRQDFLELNGSFNKDMSYEFVLSSSDIQLSRLQVMESMDSTGGLLTLNLTGKGTIADPRVSGTLNIRDARFKGKRLEDVGVNIHLKDQLARLSASPGFNLEADYHLKRQDFNASLVFDKTDLLPYFALSGQTDLSGVLTGRVEAGGNVSKIDEVNASVKLARLAVQYSGLPLITTENADIGYAGGDVAIGNLALELGGAGRLDISGKGNVAGPYQFKARGDIPLSIAGAFAPDLSDLSGGLVVRADLTGSQEAPDIRGELAIKDLQMTVPGLMQKLHHLNGKIQFAGDKLIVSDLNGKLDEGTLRLKGSAGLENFQPQTLDLQLEGNAVPIVIPDAMDLLGDVSINLKGTEERTDVTGEIVVLEGLYYQDIKINLLQSVGKKTRKEAPPTKDIDAPFLKSMHFDVRIKNREPFKIDNNLAQAALETDVSLIGTLNRPALGGRAEFLSGTVFFRKNIFTVRKGVIDFLNPYEIEPTLAIESEVAIRDYLISLSLQGTPEKLIFKLGSIPHLEDEDILSLLVTGKTATELSGNESGESPSTEALLKQTLARLAAGRIKKSAGLDILEIETGTGKESGNKNSDRVRVTIGKQLSRRLAAKVAVESKGGGVKQKAIAEYKLLEGLLFNGFQDTDGAYGGEVQIIWDFR